MGPSQLWETKNKGAASLWHHSITAYVDTKPCRIPSESAFCIYFFFSLTLTARFHAFTKSAYTRRATEKVEGYSYRSIGRSGTRATGSGVRWALRDAKSQKMRFRIILSFAVMTSGHRFNKCKQLTWARCRATLVPLVLAILLFLVLSRSPFVVQLCMCHCPQIY